MSAPAKLAAFALVLALLFGAGWILLSETLGNGLCLARRGELAVCVSERLVGRRELVERGYL